MFFFPVVFYMGLLAGKKSPRKNKEIRKDVCSMMVLSTLCIVKSEKSPGLLFSGFC